MTHFLPALHLLRGSLGPAAAGRRARLAAATLLALVGCAALLPATLRAQDPSSPDEPATLFRELERRLLDATSVSMDFRVTAEGAAEVELEGRLEMGPDDRLLLEARGRFGARDVDLRLTADSGRYTFGDGPDRASAPVPAALREAIVIGFTRMGVLHNLARLTGDAPPDHADGGVRDWVRVHSFASADGIPSSFGFYITVAGQPSGTASLELGPGGEPLVRRQTVQFPSGPMRVTERYTNVVIEG